MADMVDVGNELAAMHIDMAILDTKANLGKDVPVPNGFCHFCEDDVAPPRIFCNSACATDYEKYNR